MTVYPSAMRSIAVPEENNMYFVEGRASNRSGILDIDAARLIPLPMTMDPIPLRFHFTGIVKSKQEKVEMSGEAAVQFSVKSYSKGATWTQEVVANVNRSQYQKVFLIDVATVLFSSVFGFRSQRK